MICPDCNGRRRIVLLTTEEDCTRCGAKGEVPDAPALYPDPLGVGKSTCEFRPGLNVLFCRPRNRNRELCPAQIDHADAKFVLRSKGLEFRFEFMQGQVTDGYLDQATMMRYYLLELGHTGRVGIDAVVECRDSLPIGRGYTFSLIADAVGRLHTFAQESP